MQTHLSHPLSRPLSTVLTLLAASALALAAEPAPPAGFISLFNGRDLSGWHIPEGDGGHWKVIDGVIDYDAESQAPGSKDLWTEREFRNFVLRIDWRIKDTPFINPNVPYILPDGTHARDVHGRPLRMALPDSDSGIGLRGDITYQVNIWCWPIGSGEMYGIRTRSNIAPELRAAVTPRTQADRPVGEWNTFEITVRGNTVIVVLNDRLVLPGATIPDLPPTGRIGLQHHGSKRNGEWTSSPSLMQFRNIFLKELPE
ncbi:MAG: DUF1080 domain-containing protein [Verrucomicrobiae bacterium]|nr:DUF1080 domain-containing protein [Verrucomicrobiae bacterium]